MLQPKVSVIIAVYKVENYIERCLHALFRQTLDNIEYIFVDDGSPDASIQILEKVLEKYPERRGQVKIIRHNENKGIAAARTSGILEATGEYMIHCDPDDYIELNMYEEMYNLAIKENSDLIVCDYIKEKINEKERVSLFIDGTPRKYLKRKKGMLFWGAPLWNVLVRSNIIHKNKIIPYEGGDLGEDYACLIRIFYFSESLSYINKAFYHYNKREGSLTDDNYFNKNTFENFKKYQISMNGIFNFLDSKNEYKKLSNLIKLRTKFIWRGLFTENMKDWFYLYKESHPYIFVSPELNWKAKIYWYLLLSNYRLFKMFLK